MLEAFIVFLLSDMDSKSFQKREAATATLATFNYFYDVRPHIIKHGLKHRNLEVRKRTERILSDYENVEPVGSYWPRVDYINQGQKDELRIKIVDFYLENFSTDNWNDYDYELDATMRRASLDYAVARIRAGTSRWKVLYLLNSAIAAEKKDFIVPR